jgi:hypothetical protein
MKMMPPLRCVAATRVRRLTISVLRSGKISYTGDWTPKAEGKPFMTATITFDPRRAVSRFSRHGANHGRSGGGSMTTPMRPPQADDAEPSPDTIVVNGLTEQAPDVL